MNKKIVLEGTIAELQNKILLLCNLAEQNGLKTLNDVIEFMSRSGENEK